VRCYDSIFYYQVKKIRKGEMLSEDVFCEDMFREILSKLPVKSLMRFMCVSKYFQSLILDPHFVTMHFQNSRKNTKFLSRYLNERKIPCFVIPSPIHSLLEDSTPFYADDITHGSNLERNKYQVIGSCNGLVCLAIWKNRKGPSMFHLLNPATKKLLTCSHSSLKLAKEEIVVMLGFGYDDSRHTYKVVEIVRHMNFEYGHPFRSIVCSLNEESGWRDIQNFPANPTTVEGEGIYLNNTLNWLGMPNYNYYNYDDLDISFDEVVIASLDLETETYTKMSLPHELDGVFIGDFCFPCDQLHCNDAPFIGILGGCLSLFLRNRTTEYLSIWQMKEFGNQRSWTLLLNTSLQDLGVHHTIRLPANSRYHYYLQRILIQNQHFWSDDNNLIPLCMIENDRDIVIIQTSFQGRVKILIYNLRDKTVTSKKMIDTLSWIYPFDHVESLVSVAASSRT